MGMFDAFEAMKAEIKDKRYQVPHWIARVLECGTPGKITRKAFSSHVIYVSFCGYVWLDALPSLPPCLLLLLSRLLLMPCDAHLLALLPSPAFGFLKKLSPPIRPSSRRTPAATAAGSSAS
jgi:hypothetical protein